MSDYVIVGAGSAGCVLANRLSADPSTSVTLLEAGGPDDLPAIADPSAFLSLRGSQVDWALATEPQKQLDFRRINYPRGKVLGGSSSTNYLLYMRGNAADYDAWEAAGNPGWGWAHMLPRFRAMEDSPRGNTLFHGVNGPLKLSDQNPDRPPSHPFLSACAEQGLPLLEDFFGDRQEGASYLQITARDGVRQSAATAYLRPVRHRENLTVLTHAHALRIEFEATRATAVTYEKDGQSHTLSANKEIILCAGAIGSPQLLMVSGVGPRADLRALGIDLVADLPGVGRNLHDHPAVITAYSVQAPPEDWSGLIGAGAFLHTAPGLPEPDLQLLYAPDPASGLLAVFVIAVTPRSRGRLTITSSDSRHAPSIDPNYLDDPRDREVLADGLALTRRLLADPAFASVHPTELAPGLAVSRPHQIDDWINVNLDSAAHPVGTCAMGRGSVAVVDHRLRVRGVSNLRVVDASIMPTIVNANTNAPVIAIAERAADLITEREIPASSGLS